jgi:hypothetical protein
MAAIAPPVRHLVVELRYAPSLVFYSKMDEIGIAFAEQYPDWERSPLTLEIRNKKHHRRCYLSFQRSFYESLGFPVEGPEYDKAQKIFDRLHHELKFTKLTRIGIRQWASVASTEPLPRLVERVKSTLHPRSDHLDQILRGRVDDLAYVANVRTEADWTYRLHVGPMERKQWFEFIPHELNLFESREDFEKYKDGVPERMFFIDMDSFREDIPYVDVTTMIGTVRKVSAEILTDLVKFLQG